MQLGGGAGVLSPALLLHLSRLIAAPAEGGCATQSLQQGTHMQGLLAYLAPLLQHFHCLSSTCTPSCSLKGGVTSGTHSHPESTSVWTHLGAEIVPVLPPQSLLCKSKGLLKETSRCAGTLAPHLQLCQDTHASLVARQLSMQCSSRLVVRATKCDVHLRRLELNIAAFNSMPIAAESPQHPVATLMA